MKVFFSPKFDKSKIMLFMHGSSGFIKSNMWYINYFVKLGYTVFCPDHTVYCKKCLGYTSTPRLILRKNSKLKHIYEDIIKLRMFEIKTVMKYLQDMECKEIVLSGISEGAICVSRYKNINKLVSKKLIISYSPEINYFNPVENPLNSKGEMVYNFIGTKDEYFSNNKKSVSYNTHLGINHGNCTTVCLNKGYTCKVYIFSHGKHNLLLHYKDDLMKILKNIL